MGPTSTTEKVKTPHGIEQLVRTWPCESGPWGAVLLVHGLGAHSGCYEATGRLLAEQGLHVRSFDLTGFGQSGGVRAFVPSWEHYLDEVADHLLAVRQLGLPTLLLGHSMGALVSLCAVMRDRRKPDGLVLIAPSLDASVPAWKRKLAPFLSVVAPRFRFPNDVTPDQLSRDPDVGRAWFDDPWVCHTTTARLGSEAFSAMARLHRALKVIGVPTLVLHGGADTLVPPRFSEPLAALPGVERKVYPALRHDMLNEPEGPEVLAEIAEWMRSRVAGDDRGAG